MNQHYVPRVYLKNFAQKKGKDFFVNLFDKVNKNHFNINIKNICAETNLYTLDNSSMYDGDNLVIESLYSNFIEPMYEKTFETLTNDKIVRITNSQRHELLLGIFQLYFRNPIIFRKGIEFHKKNIELIYHINKAKNLKGLTYLDEDFSFKEFNLIQIQETIIKKLGNIFKEQHIWGNVKLGEVHENSIIQVNKIIDDSADFLTNDNPLFFEDILQTQKQNPFQKSGEFILPINEKYLVTVFQDKSKNSNNIYRQKILNGNVHFINKDIFENAGRFVIGKRKVFDEFERQSNFFEQLNTVETTMDLAKQILSIDAFIKTNPEGIEVLKFYYDKYTENNTLTPEEEHDFQIQFIKIRKKHKLNKINQ